MNINELTATAQKLLVASLEKFKNQLSIPHKKTLFVLVESILNMAQGRLKGRVAFGISTGCGKTRAVIETAAAIHHAKAELSMVVCASRIEALCTMKRDMMEAGIPESSIGLMYRPPAKKDKQYSLPRTEGNQSRQFILISHQRLREPKADINEWNIFHSTGDEAGRKRDVLIYDESLLVSDIEHFWLKDLSKSINGWRGELKFRKDEDHTDMLNWLTEWDAILEAAFSGFDVSLLNRLDQPTTQLTGEQIATYAGIFKAAGDDDMENFIQLQGYPLRMLKNQREAIITYRIAIPEDLKDIIILDASYPVRKLEKDDTSIINAETLPSCKVFRLDFGGLKRFDNVTLYRMSHHSGRHSVASNKTKMRNLNKDVCKIVKDIPADEGVLIFVYKDKNGRNPAKALDIELRHVGIDLEDDLRLPTGEKRINIITWGNETSLNDYHFCKHVVLVGIMHRELTELEAQFLGTLNDIDRKLTPDDMQSVSLSERVHLAYQALSRGSCRVMTEPSQADAMTGYIVEYDEGIEAGLSSVMPGVTWKTWEPTYSDLIAHGKLVVNLADRLERHLKDLAIDLTEKSAKRVWSDIHATRYPRETRSKAVAKVEARNPQWKQVDQWFKRV